MEKSDILRMFLEKGYQIDIETLNFFSKNEKQLKIFLEEIEKQTAPSTITKDFVDLVLQSDIEITVHQTEKKIITAEDLAKILFNRYDKLKRILVTHLDLVNLLSINKITEKTKKFSLIGIVSAIDETTGNVTIVDDTGEVNMKVDRNMFNNILVNDVLGFICEKNEKMNIRNIIFPDLPLRRTIKNLSEEKRIIVTEKITEEIMRFCKKEKNQFYIFTFSAHADENQFPPNMKFIHIDNNPTTAIISKDISVFLFNGSFLKTPMRDRKVDEFLIALLKKRYLNATNIFDYNFANNIFILENVPDVIAVKNLGEAIQTNYKGTTILTVNENTAWIINLKTREIIKLNTV
jgi:DNA polymerase II small subunit/DNA polymerase delta subunit B